MIRLVVGYKVARSEEPTTLYCGHSALGAQKAIDGAEGFAIIEIAEVPVMRRAKRSRPAADRPAVPAEKAAPKRKSAGGHKAGRKKKNGTGAPAVPASSPQPPSSNSTPEPTPAPSGDKEPPKDSPEEPPQETETDTDDGDADGPTL